MTLQPRPASEAASCDPYAVAARDPAARARAVGPAKLRQLQRMTSEGTTVTQAARILKVSRSTACAALASTR